ncbi:MAG: hypothetical protein RSA53_12055, partial [Odoribacter sp.]
YYIFCCYFFKVQLNFDLIRPMKRFWNVVHICVRAEKKVQKLLQMRGMNCYLPVQTITCL